MQALVLALTSSDGTLRQAARAWLLHDQDADASHQQLRRVVAPFSQPSDAQAGLLEFVRARVQHLHQQPASTAAAPSETEVWRDS